MPSRYTPYGLRRGGATAMFQYCGSFDRVMDQGRWGSLAACRLYITTALNELAECDEERETQSVYLQFAKFLRHLP